MSHKIEAAPTARASCRGCKETIPKGALRFGEEFANPYSEDGGQSFRYWHLGCAATKLANELAPVLAAYDETPVEDRASIEASVTEHMRPPMPYAEHAPNGRARCRGCDKSIGKGELRVAFERAFDGPMGLQKGAAYAHARCLFGYLEREKARGGDEPDPRALLREIESHSRVGAEDLTIVRTALGL